MCSSAGSTFAWVGTILVNLAFITFIVWGASTNWPIGFAISGLYTVFLFYLANWLSKRNLSGGEDTGEETTEGNEELAILVGLLYGVGVIAIGVTGFFLPINIFECDSYSSYETAAWTTNVESLPSGVQSWALEGNGYNPIATFGYVENTGVTLFSGTDGSSSGQNRAWKIDPSSADPPQLLPEYYSPSQFVNVTATSVCFTFRNKDGSNGYIACTDGEEILTNEDSNVSVFNSPTNLLASEDILWFKEIRYPSSLIYSLDPTTMEEMLYSVLQNSTSTLGSETCDEAANSRQRAVLALFVTALPVTIVSLFLWRNQSIASMGATTFIGVSLIFLFGYILFDPLSSNLDDALQWWFPLSGAAYILTLTHLLLTNDALVQAPLLWGINLSAIAFAVGMVFLVDVFDNDSIGYWLLLTFLAFLPLIVLGILTDLIFLTVLGAIGLLLDSWRIARFFGDFVGDGLEVPIQFLVLATAGILIGLMGNYLNQKNEDIKTVLFKLFRCWAPSNNSAVSEITNEGSRLIA